MIVFDMEATSLDHVNGAMVSLGAVDMADPTRTYYREYRIWNGARVDDEALAVNGFSQEEITDVNKPLFAEVAQQLIDWINECSSQILAGHNVMFDINFLKAEFDRAGIDWPWGHRSIDLHTVAFTKVFKETNQEPLRSDGHSKMSLGEVCKLAGITFERDKTHNALEDAKLTADCLSRLLFDNKLYPEYD